MKKVRSIFIVLISVLLVITNVSCSTNLITPTISKNIGFNSYNGKVSLSIDNGLIEKTGNKLNSERAIVNLSDTFGIKAIPQGNILFQEVFTKTNSQASLQKNFNISDISKKYTLYVKNGDNNKKNRVSSATVSINGTQILKQNDFNANKEEIIKSNLTLKNGNSLEVKINDNAGSFLTIHIVDENPFSDNGEVNYRNTSLKVGVAQANNTIANILLGRVIVKVGSPAETNLALLEQRYSGKIADKIALPDTDTYLATLEIDKDNLASVDLQNLDENIAQQNQTSEAQITSVVFSSINTARTVAVFYDILVNSRDIAINAGLDYVGEDLASGDEIITKEGNNKGSGEQWWLSSNNDSLPNITKAWNYSAGYDVNIALIDNEFGLIQDYPDFKDRVIIKDELLSAYNKDFFTQCNQAKVIGWQSVIDNNGKKVFATEGDYKWFCYQEQSTSAGILDTPPDHGYMSSSFAAANIDNEHNIAGTAFGTKIIPVTNRDGNVDSTLRSLIRLLFYEENGVRKKLADIINISSGQSVYVFQKHGNETVSLNKINQTFRDPTIVTLQKYIDLAVLDLNIIVVASAGNSNNNTPVIPAACNNVISVGAYSPNLTRPSITADRASNYGVYVDIWAPGYELFVDLPDNKISNWSFNRKENQFGTSFAAPITSGVIALMRSWKPNLTSAQALSILQNTGTALTDNSFHESVGQKTINAYKAVTHSSINAKLAVELRGMFNNGSISVTDSSNHNNGETVVPTYNYLSVYPDLIGKEVEVIGWLARDRANFSNGLSFSPENIQVLQMKNFTSTHPGNTGTDEIVTDTNWTWTAPDGTSKSAVIVDQYTSSIRIPNASDGRTVKPIWSEINPPGSQYPGTAICGDCTYNFNQNYIIPSNSHIESAKVEIQCDDNADIYINNIYVGSVSYASTFGSNTYSTLNIPVNTLQAGNNTLTISLHSYNGPIVSPYEAYNFAAVAAKLTVNWKKNVTI